jgi:hypothetical protein
VRAIRFSSDKTPVLRFSRQNSGASFRSNDGNLVCPAKPTTLPGLPKQRFTKGIESGGIDPELHRGAS